MDCARVCRHRAVSARNQSQSDVELTVDCLLVFAGTELYQLVIKANQTENSERRMLKLKKLLHELPEMNFETFRFLARHLAVIASKEEVNKVGGVRS